MMIAERGDLGLAEWVQALDAEATRLAREERLDECGPVIEALRAIEEDELVAAEPGVAKDLLDAAGKLVPSGALAPLSRVYVTVVQSLARNPRARTDDTVPGLYNLASLADAAGEAEARDSAINQLLALASQLQIAPGQAAARAFMELARIFDRQGKLEPVAILYRPLHAHMMDPAQVSSQTRLGWLSMYATLLQRLGRPGDFELSRELCALGVAEAAGSGEEQGLWLLRFHGMAGQAAAMVGDHADALASYRAALPHAEAHAASHAHFVSTLYHNAGGALLREGRVEELEEAARLTRRALELAEQQGEGPSPDIAGGVSHLAQIAERQGDLEQSAAHYTRCFEIFDAAAEKDEAEHAACLTDAGFLHLRRRAPEPAAEVFASALAKRRALGTQPVVEAADLSNLATACYEGGSLDDAIALYGEAIALRHCAAEFLAGEPALLHLHGRGGG